MREQGRALEHGVRAAFAAVDVQTACSTKQREGRGKDRVAFCEATLAGEPITFGMVAEGLGDVAVVDWVHLNILNLYIRIAADDPSANALLRAGQQAVEQAHQEAMRITGGTSRAGCTLTLCAINRVRNELTTVNIGACAAVLFARDRVTRLTDDHRLQASSSEQERLKAMNVVVSRAQDAHGGPVGPLRAWPGGLLCARAIGNVGPTYVSAQPTCSSVVLMPNGGDVLICSDGVWDELLVSVVSSIARSCPSAVAAARLVVESAAAQHTSYDQRGYGQPRDDTSW